MSPNSRFYDSDGNSLEKYDDIWNKLYDFYGKYLPDKVTVKHACQGGLSTFEPDEKALTLDCSRHEDPKRIAHESSHIALYYMTKGASYKELFRFLDEGLATVVAERIAGNSGKHKQKVLYKTCLEKNNGKATIDNLQSWSVYFGDWKDHLEDKDTEKNFDAYFTSASVIYHILDNYGEKTLKRFLADIGQTQDLKTSTLSVLGMDLTSFEKNWLAYLDNHCKRLSDNPVNVPVEAVFMSPKNGSDNIDPKINKLVVKFNVTMDSSEICVLADCNEICYTNAYWEDDKTLAVKLPNGLISKKDYSLFLGSKRCRLKSLLGESAPIITWHFSTK